MTTNQHGFLAAWAAYQCAMHGHVWTWTSDRTDGVVPPGALCSRCGTINGR